MGMYLSVIFGVLSIAAGLAGLVWWWRSFLILLEAALPVVLILGGAISTIAGMSLIRGRVVAPEGQKNSN